MALVPRLVARNWRLKLSALGLTLFLWAVVRAQEPTSQDDLFTVPVRAQVGDLAWTLAGGPTPASVQVRFRGPPDDLIRLAREGTSVRVPIDSVTSPDTVIQLRRDWVVVGAGSSLVVEDISPASVRVRLQPTLSSLLPLSVSLVGELPEGMALAAPVGLNPQLVRVRGAAPRVRALDSIPLEPLDLAGVSGSGIYTVAVDTAGLGGVTVAPAEATLGLRLEPATERVLAGVPVMAVPGEGGPLPDSLVIEPGSIQVRLQGARTPVAGTRAEEVQAVVPPEAWQGLAPGEARRAPIRLRGLPTLVRGFSAVDSVTVRRPLAATGSGPAAAPDSAAAEPVAGDSGSTVRSGGGA